MRNKRAGPVLMLNSKANILHDPSTSDSVESQTTQGALNLGVMVTDGVWGDNMGLLFAVNLIFFFKQNIR